MPELSEINELILKKVQQWVGLLLGVLAIVGAIVTVSNKFNHLDRQISELTLAFQSYKKEQELTLKLLEANLKPVSQNLQSIVDSKLRQADAANSGGQP